MYGYIVYITYYIHKYTDSPIMYLCIKDNIPILRFKKPFTLVL